LRSLSGGEEFSDLYQRGGGRGGGGLSRGGGASAVGSGGRRPKKEGIKTKPLRRNLGTSGKLVAPRKERKVLRKSKGEGRESVHLKEKGLDLPRRRKKRS